MCRGFARFRPPGYYVEAERVESYVALGVSREVARVIAGHPAVAGFFEGAVEELLARGRK